MFALSQAKNIIKQTKGLPIEFEVPGVPIRMVVCSETKGYWSQNIQVIKRLSKRVLFKRYGDIKREYFGAARSGLYR